MHNRRSMIHALLVAIGLAALALPASQSTAWAATQAAYVEDEVLVRLRPGVSVRSIAAGHGLTADPGQSNQLAHGLIHRLTIADGSSPPKKAAALMRDWRVTYAEPNYVGQLPEARQRSSWVVGDGDDPALYTSQWAADKIGLSEAHRVSRGAAVTVAMLDTGVYAAHPALAMRLVAGYDFVDDDADPSEEGKAGVDYAYGHGTHVAGLIALAAPEARIMTLRTLEPNGIGTVWNQALALAYAADQGADVANISFSFQPRSRVLADVISEITCSAGGACAGGRSPGVVVVAAAGNSGVSEQEYPAAEPVPGLIAVGASTADDTLATFSTYGPWVRIVAPGDRVLSSVPPDGYAAWSGTSMAAPLTSGTVALLRAAEPRQRPAEIASRLTTSAASIDGPIRRRIDAVAVLDGTIGR